MRSESALRIGEMGSSPNATWPLLTSPPASRPEPPRPQPPARLERAYVPGSEATCPTTSPRHSRLNRANIGGDDENSRNVREGGSSSASATQVALAASMTSSDSAPSPSSIEAAIAREDARVARLEVEHSKSVARLRELRATLLGHSALVDRSADQSSVPTAANPHARRESTPVSRTLS